MKDLIQTLEFESRNFILSISTITATEFNFCGHDNGDDISTATTFSKCKICDHDNGDDFSTAKIFSKL